MSDRMLEENLAALLRAADDRPDVDRACAVFLGRVQAPRPRPWLAVASAAALILAILWGVGGDRALGSQAQIEGWIRDLGAEDASVRDRASRAFGDLGLDLAYALGALDRRDRRLAGDLRDGVGREISHEDAPAIKPAPKDSPLRLDLYDVTDMLEENTMTGEDLAQLIKANVRPESWKQDGAGMSFHMDEGIMEVRNTPEVQDALRAFFADLRAGATKAPPRPLVEGRLADRAWVLGLGKRYRWALGALERLQASADPELRLRARELRATMVEALAPLFTHHVLRRAAIERIREEWARRKPQEREDLIRKAFEPCRVQAIELVPDLSKSDLPPKSVEALRRGDGVVSLWRRFPFSFRTLGARQTTLAFTIPGDPTVSVAVRFER